MHQFDRRLRLRRGKVSGGLNGTNEAWERWCGRLPADNPPTRISCANNRHLWRQTGAHEYMCGVCQSFMATAVRRDEISLPADNPKPAAITSAQADRIIALLERIERRLGDGGRAAA